MTATVEHPAHSSANRRRQSHVCYISKSLFIAFKFSIKMSRSLLNVMHIACSCLLHTSFVSSYCTKLVFYATCFGHLLQPSLYSYTITDKRSGSYDSKC